MAEPNDTSRAFLTYLKHNPNSVLDLDSSENISKRWGQHDNDVNNNVVLDLDSPENISKRLEQHDNNLNNNVVLDLDSPENIIKKLDQHANNVNNNVVSDSENISKRLGQNEPNISNNIVSDSKNVSKIVGPPENDVSNNIVHAADDAVTKEPLNLLQKYDNATVNVAPALVNIPSAVPKKAEPPAAAPQIVIPTKLCITVNTNIAGYSKIMYKPTNTIKNAPSTAAVYFNPLVQLKKSIIQGV